MNSGASSRQRGNEGEKEEQKKNGKTKRSQCQNMSDVMRKHEKKETQGGLQSEKKRGNEVGQLLESQKKKKTRNREKDLHKHVHEAH
jgi:uncharacterized membrane protein YgaE (UPF0421/DUF939 family)